MPAITRSMKKTVSSAKPISAAPVQITPISIPLSPDESLFVLETKNLLFQCEHAQGKEAKMRIALQIYKNNNDILEKLLLGNQMKWVKYAASVYSKTAEFYNQMISGFFNEISDKKLVATFIEEFVETRKFLSSYFTNLKKNCPSHVDMNDKLIVQAMKEIENKKLMTRPRRSVPRVDYTGMDMCEGEEGSVSVCVVKWNNRVPSYRWVKYPASKANELFDKDWQP